MSGFWHLSHHQMRDMNGAVYAGARAYFFDATTLLQITVYQDYGLGTPHPNPVQANAYGIFPPVFFDETDEFYRQRITSAGGVLIPGTDVGTLPIIGPGVGGGGGSEVPVDENAILKTGDPLWVPVSGARAGFVRANFRTIGSVASGASERANADCESLYLHLHATYSDTLCPVTGGRGVSAAADWAANKPLGILDLRGKAPFGLDGMGNSRANVIADAYVSSGDGDSPASIGGTDDEVLTVPKIPAHSHTPTVNPADDHTHFIANSEEVAEPAALDLSPTRVMNYYYSTGDVAYKLQGSGNAAVAGKTSEPTGTQPSVLIGNTGGGAAHNNMSPFMLGTWYLKLAILLGAYPALKIASELLVSVS